MSDQRKPLSEQKEQQQKHFDELPLHVRQMLHDEWRRLREIREAPEDPTRGSWL